MKQDHLFHDEVIRKQQENMEGTVFIIIWTGFLMQATKPRNRQNDSFNENCEKKAVLFVRIMVKKLVFYYSESI